MFKGVIFDMDGVLFDTEQTWQDTWQELAAELGIELEKSFTRTVSGTNGEAMRKVIRRFFHTEECDPIIRECTNRVSRKLLDHVPLKPGVVEILEYFKEKGLKMTVASSSRREQIESNLRITGFEKYFDEIVSGHEVEHGKPAPDVFLKAAEKIQCKPEECFVFEDSENGVRAGYAANCAVMMIPDMFAPSEEIKPYCTEIYESFIQVKEEIGKYL